MKTDVTIYNAFPFAADMTYVNLQLNPEHYTGYSGPSARRIWDSVYSENCPKCGFSLSLSMHASNNFFEAKIFII